MENSKIHHGFDDDSKQQWESLSTKTSTTNDIFKYQSNTCEKLLPQQSTVSQVNTKLTLQKAIYLLTIIFTRTYNFIES